jgi:hypothetical protein
VGDDELAAQFQEELKRLKVSDVLVQTLYTVSSLGYHKLGAEHRDLAQARLAIESLRALLPVMQEAVPEEVVRDFNQVVANLQLAYAAAVREAPPAEEPEAEEPKAETPQPDEPDPDVEDLEPVDEEELGAGD